MACHAAHTGGLQRPPAHALQACFHARLSRRVAHPQHQYTPPHPRYVYHIAHSTAQATRELSMLDEAAVLHLDRLHQPSDEFVKLCNRQLRILSRLLTPDTAQQSTTPINIPMPMPNHLRSAVYVRTAASLESGNLHFIRVAMQGPAAPHATGRAAVEMHHHPQAEDALLILGAGGAYGQVSDAATEQSLVSQDVLVLPDNGAVVVPLKHDALLVGLLVLERTGGGSGGGVALQQQQQKGMQPSPHVVLHPKPKRSTAWVTIHDDEHSGHSVDVSMDGSDDDEDTIHAPQQHLNNIVIQPPQQQYAQQQQQHHPTPTPAGPPWGPDKVLHTEEQWHAVCDVSQTLSAAATLEQRATLELAYHMAGRSSLQGLVAEVSQPLRTLRTLGALLAPRVSEEAGNRDMVEGILAQGDRLQQVASQLQAALHPWDHPQHTLTHAHNTPTRPLDTTTSSSSSSSSSHHVRSMRPMLHPSSRKSKK